MDGPQGTNKALLDAPVEEAVAAIMSQQGTSGVVAVDSNGLCLSAKGVAPSKGAGFVRAIAVRAKEFSETEQPVVVIETDAQNIYIQATQAATVAVYKTHA